MATKTDQGILLEAGTNEVEILVFEVAGQMFGVNVAKVREVLDIGDTTALPESHPAAEAMVQVRENVVMLVNLRRFLFPDGLPDAPPEGNRMLLLEFNQQLLGFRVDDVDRIIRSSWNNSFPAPEEIGPNAPITGILLLGERILPMLDFESIGAEVGLDREFFSNTHDVSKVTEKRDLPIIFAEDSRMISEVLRDELSDAGYTNVENFPDGADAWAYLETLLAIEDGQPISSRVAAIITDVEMPRMDGLNFTKRIRSTPQLAGVPVVLFSSLVSQTNRKKGDQVGATAQVSKPRYTELIETLNGLLSVTA